MEVCLYCKKCLLIDGMAGSAVCIKDYIEDGAFMASLISYPERHTCKKWEGLNE